MNILIIGKVTPLVQEMIDHVKSRHPEANFIYAPTVDMALDKASNCGQSFEMVIHTETAIFKPLPIENRLRSDEPRKTRIKGCTSKRPSPQTTVAYKESLEKKPADREKWLNGTRDNGDSGERGSGRTTRQLLAAPHGAHFICPNHNNAQFYTARLADHLGRKDIVLCDPDWITSNRWRGIPLTAVILDHATRLTARQADMLPELYARIRAG
jgi:hypothetical protein